LRQKDNKNRIGIDETAGETAIETATTHQEVSFNQNGKINDKLNFLCANQP